MGNLFESEMETPRSQGHAYLWDVDCWRNGRLVVFGARSYQLYANDRGAIVAAVRVQGHPVPYHHPQTPMERSRCERKIAGLHIAHANGRMIEFRVNHHTRVSHRLTTLLYSFKNCDWERYEYALALICKNDVPQIDCLYSNEQVHYLSACLAFAQHYYCHHYTPR